MSASFQSTTPSPTDPDAPPRRGFGQWARRHRAWLALSGSLMALVTVMTLTQPLPRLDRLLQDNVGTWPVRTASNGIVIVAIDDKTLDAIGRFPWRRALHAELLRRIGAQAPRCIGMDVLMTEPDAAHPGDNAVLANAMLDVGCVVLPMALRRDGPGQLRELLPEPVLAAAAAGIGHAHVSLDQDGVARSVYLREGFPGRQWPHFALALQTAAMARAAGTPSPLTARPPAAAPSRDSAERWQRSAHELIVFAQRTPAYRTVSYIDVLRDAVPADAFRGKLVLIGATAPGLGNDYATPLPQVDGLLPGIEIFANILQGLQSGKRLVVATPWEDLAYNLVPMTIALLGLLWLRPMGAVGLILLLLSIRFALHAARLQLGMQFAPAAGFAGLLLVVPLWSLLRLTAAIRYLRWGTEQLLLEGAWLQPALAPSTGRKPAARRAGDFLDRQMAITAAAARRMRDLHRFVRDGVTHLPDATLVLDAAGMVLMSNLAALRHWHVAPEALAGQDAHAMLADIRWRGTQKPMLPAAALRHTLEPIVGEGEDARGRSVLLRCVPLFDVANDHAGWMVSLVDLTPMRRAQGQRDEALRFISHDIREPSAAILTIVELARAHPQAQSPEQLLSRVERHARTGLALADGFVNLARAEASPFRPELLDLVALGQQALDDAWAAARKRQIRMLSGSTPDEALFIGDRDLLSRALANIVSNAIKFSPSGGEVVCSIALRELHWAVTVRDQGPGIPVALQSQLFQPFHRLHGNSHPEAQGVGLGLLLVRTVALRHGGSVEIDSAADAGCAVTLLLPRSSEAELAASSLPEE